MHIENCKFYERFGAIREECCLSCVHFIDDDPGRYPYCSVGCDKLYFPFDPDFLADLSDFNYFDCLTYDLPF